MNPSGTHTLATILVLAAVSMAKADTQFLSTTRQTGTIATNAPGLFDAAYTHSDSTATTEVRQRSTVDEWAVTADLTSRLHTTTGNGSFAPNSLNIRFRVDRDIPFRFFGAVTKSAQSSGDPGVDQGWSTAEAYLTSGDGLHWVAFPQGLDANESLTNLFYWAGTFRQGAQYSLVVNINHDVFGSPRGGSWDETWTVEFDLVLDRLGWLPSQDGLQLLWPRSATNLVVQATADFLPPIQWASVTNQVVPTEDSISITVPYDQPRRFFRLIRGTP